MQLQVISLILLKLSKSFGSPTAAGLMALLHAMATATHASLPQNLHLRNLNTHVAASLESSVGTHTSSSQPGQFTVPRQAACFTHREPLVGCSGFAFQGTNAHVLLSTATPRPPATASSNIVSSVSKPVPTHAWSCDWRPQHLWLLPPASQMLQRASAPLLKPPKSAVGEAVFETDLCAARLSWLHDHVVGGVFV